MKTKLKAKIKIINNNKDNLKIKMKMRIKIMMIKKMITIITIIMEEMIKTVEMKEVSSIEINDYTL